MSFARIPCPEGRLAEIARHWGYDYAISRDGPTTGPALLNGHIQSYQLSPGINLCCNDQLALADNQRVGTLNRSLMLILHLGGDEPGYLFDDNRRLPAAQGGATLVAAARASRIACQYPKGHRCRSLVLQVTPQHLTDARLAEAVDGLLASDRLGSFSVDSRLCRLSNECFAPMHDGVVADLLAQSCGLELLARGLASVRQEYEAPVRGEARILRVRDRLLDELEGEHCLLELAREAGMSVSTLKSRFREVTGQTVFGFLREQRLFRARQGLEREGWTVKQAAYFVGYRHPSNFSIAYSRRFGQSPGRPRA